MSTTSSSNYFHQIRLVATDMDGTLTKSGKFTSRLLQSFDDLAQAGIKVIIVTGRSAGWVSGLAYYLPIFGAVAENGGLFYMSATQTPITLTPISDIQIHRQQLAQIFAELKAKFPQIQESADNRFRITDWTFDVTSLKKDQLQSLGNLCQEMKWGFTYSNVQCHIKPLEQDKSVGLLQVLRQYFPQYTKEEIITIGDSPNDESLFNSTYFPISVGVANVREYTSILQHQPAYITTGAEGDGFCELVDLILTRDEEAND